jgi:hypothetical protein
MSNFNWKQGGKSESARKKYQQTRKTRTVDESYEFLKRNKDHEYNHNLNYSDRNLKNNEEIALKQKTKLINEAEHCYNLIGKLIIELYNKGTFNLQINLQRSFIGYEIRNNKIIIHLLINLDPLNKEYATKNELIIIDQINNEIISNPITEHIRSRFEIEFHFESGSSQSLHFDAKGKHLNQF